MTDILTKKQRSYNMSKIKGRDTKPELKLKEYLEKKGFVYQSKEYGKPDFINYNRRIIIFIDGCFWHKCPTHFQYPKSNFKFWKDKLNQNQIRDKEITIAYKNAGWSIVRIWEHQINF